ncbi:UPF0183 family protein [Cavenderia fasciculata]|uniref:UPF0183 family protein n=1 Tax=Cavenderia fasciculata TaxID=261658 RepID=F4QB45_CACFS|nr:UPF0183 family protein [Cavenderia fasciculata]EGG14817.1 UPF0183 family protein [Cavenderia fasciculata]|eukprot:XP_004351333.1 UPF0183 family protein [Cavenderia fasciculata]
MDGAYPLFSVLDCLTFVRQSSNDDKSHNIVYAHSTESEDSSNTRVGIVLQEIHIFKEYKQDNIGIIRYSNRDVKEWLAKCEYLFVSLFKLIKSLSHLASYSPFPSFRSCMKNVSHIGIIDSTDNRSNELVPGKCLGDFILGMTISEALNIIKHNNASIGKVEIIFNDADPLSIDIVLKLVDDGVLLRFAPSSQRLRVIEIFDVTKLSLLYRGSTFSSSDNIATFVNIYSKFGPSYPGDFNAKKSVYHLHYPGLSFSFPIPPKFNSLYSESTELPVELPDGSTPIVSKIFVYSSLQMKNPLSNIPNPQTQEDIIICPNQGVYFIKRNCILTFSSTPQDVLSELGPPSKIYHKEEDNMKIHTYQVEGSTTPDYFYNYFHLGLDVLFDVKRNTVKKLIFHTNFPTHYEFNLYAKCSFKIVQNGSSKVIFEALKSISEGGKLKSNNNNNNAVAGGENNVAQIDSNKQQQQQNNNNNNNSISPLSTSPTSSLPLIPGGVNGGGGGSNNSGSGLELQRLDTVMDPSLPTIHPDMKWEEVQQVYGKSGKPVVNNRGSVSNPFGSTFFYGYPGIIFEIMRNNYIASVCLFDDSHINYNNNNNNSSAVNRGAVGHYTNRNNNSNNNNNSSSLNDIEAGF